MPAERRLHHRTGERHKRLPQPHDDLPDDDRGRCANDEAADRGQGHDRPGEPAQAVERLLTQGVPRVCSGPTAPGAPAREEDPGGADAVLRQRADRIPVKACLEGNVHGPGPVPPMGGILPRRRVLDELARCYARRSRHLSTPLRQHLNGNGETVQESAHQSRNGRRHAVHDHPRENPHQEGEHDPHRHADEERDKYYNKQIYKDFFHQILPRLLIRRSPRWTELPRRSAVEWPSSTRIWSSRSRRCRRSSSFSSL